VSFAIAGRGIGTGRVFVIAEAGVNHNGRPDLARRLVDAAADAGADAVKFQTFEPAALVDAREPKVAYQAKNTGSQGSQLEMLAELTLLREMLVELAGRARKRDIIFLSTPFDPASADLLYGLEVPAFKIGSGDLTNLPLLRHVARMGLPMIVSTGGATLSEVAAAVDAVHAISKAPLALLHCVTSYPAPDDAANLLAMDAMRERFSLPVGWSDHMLDIWVAIAAASRGAAIVEKHLTLDRELPGPDHRASAEPDRFAEMVRAIRAVETALGSAEKRPDERELDTIRAARRSLYARRDLEPGHDLEEEDVVALRPGDGLSAARIDEFVGRTLGRRVTAGARLSETDFR